MILIESIVLFLLILVIFLSITVTIMLVRQMQLIRGVDRLTQSLTAQIIASGGLTPPQPTGYVPPPGKNEMVS